MLDLFAIVRIKPSNNNLFVELVPELFDDLKRLVGSVQKDHTPKITIRLDQSDESVRIDQVALNKAIQITLSSGFIAQTASLFVSLALCASDDTPLLPGEPQCEEFSGADDSADDSASDDEDVERRASAAMSWARTALRFATLHEIYHARLGHTMLVTSGRPGPFHGDFNVEDSLLAPDRIFLELEADKAALLHSIWNTFEGGRPDSASKLGLRLAELGLATEGLFRFTDSALVTRTRETQYLIELGASDLKRSYPGPIQRRFFLIAKLVELAATPDIGIALEDSFQYGVNAMNDWAARARIAEITDDNEFGSGDKAGVLVENLRSGILMRDPNAWVISVEANLAELRNAKKLREFPSHLRFSLA